MEEVLSLIPDCPADPSVPLFEVSPIQLSDLLEIVPLGNLNPPGHTFPTDHLYLHVRMTGAEPSTPATVAVFAPGRIWITRIQKTQYASPPSTDYSITFWPCNQFVAYFGHVEQLSENLLIHAGPFEGGRCINHSDGNITCQKDVIIETEAGEIIGVSEGGLDFGAMDSRVPPLTHANPARYSSSVLHAVCAIDYYSPDVRDRLRGRFGGHRGQRLNPNPPKEGVRTAEGGG